MEQQEKYTFIKELCVTILHESTLFDERNLNSLPFHYFFWIEEYDLSDLENIAHDLKEEKYFGYGDLGVCLRAFRYVHEQKKLRQETEIATHDQQDELDQWSTDERDFILQEAWVITECVTSYVNDHFEMINDNFERVRIAYGTATEPTERVMVMVKASNCVLLATLVCIVRYHKDIAPTIMTLFAKHLYDMLFMKYGKWMKEQFVTTFNCYNKIQKIIDLNNDVETPRDVVQDNANTLLAMLHDSKTFSKLADMNFPSSELLCEAVSHILESMQVVSK